MLHRDDVAESGARWSQVLVQAAQVWNNNSCVAWIALGLEVDHVARRVRWSSDQGAY